MKTLPDRLRELYQQDPEQTALHLLFARQSDVHITMQELVYGSAGYAQSLAAAGVRPGEVTIIILQHSADLVYAFLGAILHGAIPAIMPFLTEKLSPEQYRQSLVALFEITAPAAVITYPEFAPEVQQAIPTAGSIRVVLLSSQVQPCRTFDFAALKGVERQPQDIVLLQHSSGTTGLQKGVALSHQAVFNQLEAYSAAINLTPQDVVVSWLPLYHDMGLIAGFLLPVLSGIPLVLMSPFEWVRAPYRLFQAVSRYRGTLTWLPNFAYNFCATKIRDRDLEGVDLASWRAVSNCSEPMYYRSHQIFLNRFKGYGLRPEALATCYAMAENVFAVTQGGIGAPVQVDMISQRSLIRERFARPSTDEDDMLRMLSCGRPLDNTCVKVLNDHHKELPERHIGEIALNSDCMLTGYYHRPDATQRAFHDGWFLTGDLGYIADQEVYITGRKKDLIIVGGKNIYPQDLEALAGEVPGVYPGRVVAFGIPNEELGTEEVVILAEIDPVTLGEADPNIVYQTLADVIRQRVTRGSDIALRLVQVVERGWLLKTSSGKLARNANRDKYLELIATGGSAR